MANPQRMCVICSKSTDKKELFRFTAGEEGFTFDDKQVIQKRGIYICQSLSCIEKLLKLIKSSCIIYESYFKEHFNWHGINKHACQCSI